MKQFLTSYRKIYPWVLLLVILSMIAAFGFGLHKTSETYVINSLKIITSGITVLAFTVSIVEVLMNRRISDDAKKAATQARDQVKKSFNIIASARADFRVEMVRTSLEANEHSEYRRCNDQLKEIQKAVMLHSSDILNDPAKTLGEKIGQLRSKLSVAYKNKKVLDDYDSQIAFDLLTKLDTFINDKTKELI